MRRFLAIFKMDMINLFKNPVLVGYNTVFAALLILIMGFLCSGNYADIKDAYEYYAISFLVYGMLNGAMTASNCFMERDIKRPNLRIIYSPVGSFPIYFSKILSSFLFDYSLHLLLMLILCPTLHVSLGNPAVFILLMAPIEFAAAALGIFFCCIFKCEETTSMLLSNVISILCFLGGTFFSLDGMGSAIAFASRLSPVKWLNDAFFAIACDNSLIYFWPVFLGGIAISALLVLGCRLLFRTEDYL
ncbi:MAG TPA: ABC transporter permease [Oscillospiraceae bacterium]|nr:ABC transporter permease [Oscillospiraceae bacterium]